MVFIKAKKIKKKKKKSNVLCFQYQKGKQVKGKQVEVFPNNSSFFVEISYTSVMEEKFIKIHNHKLSGTNIQKIKQFLHLFLKTESEIELS